MEQFEQLELWPWLREREIMYRNVQDVLSTERHVDFAREIEYVDRFRVVQLLERLEAAMFGRTLNPQQERRSSEATTHSPQR